MARRFSICTPERGMGKAIKKYELSELLYLAIIL
jgi:hypothetical protein